MKNSGNYILTMFIIFSSVIQTVAQSEFSTDNYIQFIEQHQDYTAQQLLDDHQPKTTYYSNRQKPADLFSIPWYDSLNSRFQFTADENDL